MKYTNAFIRSNQAKIRKQERRKTLTTLAWCIAIMLVTALACAGTMYVENLMILKGY